MIKTSLFAILTTFCCALNARAQQNDDYVFVNEEITPSLWETTQITTLTTKEFTVSNSSLNTNTQYKIKFSESGADRFSLYSGGLITTNVSSELFLKKIKFTLFYKANASYIIKGTESPYSQVSELTSTGVEIGSVSFLLKDAELEKSIEFDSPRYHYWGIKPNDNNTPLIKKITVTWQLIYNRSNLNPGYLGTLCLPYNIKAEDMNDEITAYSIAGKVVDQNENVTSIVFTEVDHLEAGKPYVFVAKKEEVFLKYSGNKAEEASSANGLYGVFEEHPFDGDNQYSEGDFFVILKDKIQAASSNSGVHANCAYIRMSEVPILEPKKAINHALILTNEGFQQTSITQPNLHPATLSAPTTDLLGRKTRVGVTQNIIIKNGKKALVL